MQLAQLAANQEAHHSMMHQLIDGLNAVAFNISDSGRGIGHYGGHGTRGYAGLGQGGRRRTQDCGRSPPAYIGGVLQGGFPPTMAGHIHIPSGLPGGCQGDSAGGVPPYRPPAAHVMNGGYGLTGAYIPHGPPAQANVQQQPYSNLVKRYSNWNACYSCGFDMANGHTSMSCLPHLRKTSHQIGFNCHNAQQYIDLGHPCSTRNRHKTQFPTNM
jgi:hypothetical protein